MLCGGGSQQGCACRIDSIRNVFKFVPNPGRVVDIIEIKDKESTEPVGP